MLKCFFFGRGHLPSLVAKECCKDSVNPFTLLVRCFAAASLTRPQSCSRSLLKPSEGAPQCYLSESVGIHTSICCLFTITYFKLLLGYGFALSLLPLLPLSENMGPRFVSMKTRSTGKQLCALLDRFKTELFLLYTARVIETNPCTAYPERYPGRISGVKV